MEIKPHLCKSTNFVVGESITYLFYKLKYPLTIRSYLRKNIILLKIICLAISINHNEGYYKSLEQNISVLIFFGIALVSLLFTYDK